MKQKIQQIIHIIGINYEKTGTGGYRFDPDTQRFTNFLLVSHFVWFLIFSIFYSWKYIEWVSDDYHGFTFGRQIVFAIGLVPVIVNSLLFAFWQRNVKKNITTKTDKPNQEQVINNYFYNTLPENRNLNSKEYVKENSKQLKDTVYKDGKIVEL